MAEKKQILAIVGSASENSANQKLVEYIIRLMEAEFGFKVISNLKTLPHFDPAFASHNTPEEIIAFRTAIEKADGILICTPEYIFSIPSGLKNAIEWCVSTTVFSDKPIGLITASASGQKAHEELQLIMKTVMTIFSEETTLLIQGMKGKMNAEGQITDGKTKEEVARFVEAYRRQVSLS